MVGKRHLKENKENDLEISSKRLKDNVLSEKRYPDPLAPLTSLDSTDNDTNYSQKSHQISNASNLNFDDSVHPRISTDEIILIRKKKSLRVSKSTKSNSSSVLISSLQITAKDKNASNLSHHLGESDNIVSIIVILSIYKSYSYL